MQTLPLLIILFSLCGAAVALLIATVYYVKARKNASPSATPREGTMDRDPVNAAELQSVFDSISDYICIIDDRFKILYANRSYRELTGLDTGSGTRYTCHAKFWKRDTPCENCPAEETMRKGVPVLRKKFVLRDPGSARKKHLELSSYPIVDGAGRVTRVIEYIRDMTQEAGMLDELIRSEKLAGIGVMTTGIAHEMNNALSGISGTASNLLTMPEKYGLNEKAVSRVLSILDSATRATGVMKNLLQFSNPLQEETRVMINVRQLLKKILGTAYVQEAPDIERTMKFDEALPPLSADLSKVELVFMNIISNAIRSILQKKKQCLEAGLPFKGALAVSARENEGSVLITFTDNGVGIPESARSKIFDPFFSTWPGGNGTGLGLSTAMHIVEEHGGRIFFDSNEASTTFSVRLPVSSARPRTGRG
jgi:two-component system, NtrC family, sensor kinase